MKLTKSDAGYCAQGFTACCGNCPNYVRDNRCALVEGFIHPNTGVCDHWEQKR